MQQTIVSLWAQKGGVGKTNLTLHTAAGLAARGKKVLVVDFDQQNTTSFFYKMGDYPFVVVKGYPQQRPEGYDYILVDHPGLLTEGTMPDGDLVIMPTQPSAGDFHSWTASYRAIKNDKRRILPVVTLVNLTRKKEVEFVVMMREQFGAKIIRDLSIYRETLDSGMSVFSAPWTYPQRKSAQDEINQIVKWIIKNTK